MDAIIKKEPEEVNVLDKFEDIDCELEQLHEELRALEEEISIVGTENYERESENQDRIKDLVVSRIDSEIHSDEIRDIRDEIKRLDKDDGHILMTLCFVSAVVITWLLILTFSIPW